jgi:hypothetical protein
MLRVRSMSIQNTIVVACALILAPGCSRCIDTPHITIVDANLVSAAGAKTWSSEKTYMDGLDSDLIRGATTNADAAPAGGLELTLSHFDALPSQGYVRLSLPLPLASGQVIQVLAAPPPLPISDATISATRGTAPQGNLRIDPNCGGSNGPQCEPEMVTGTFTVVSTRPLSVHVDTTVTVSHASGGQEQLIVNGDLAFKVSDITLCTEFN